MFLSLPQFYVCVNNYLVFLAVLAASLKSLAEGAPLKPTFRIFSPEPALIRAFLAAMFAYKPGLVATLCTHFFSRF